MRLSLRFRVRLIWNFSICSCTHTHTHLAHTYTHLPPSVLTPPPVDDFWVPTTEDKLLGLASVVCLQGWGFAVLVCVCVPGVCRGSGLEVSTTCILNLHNLEQTNRCLFRQFRLFGLGLFAQFVWKSTPEDLSIRFGVLSNSFQMRHVVA